MLTPVRKMGCPARVAALIFRARVVVGEGMIIRTQFSTVCVLSKRRMSWVPPPMSKARMRMLLRPMDL